MNPFATQDGQATLSAPLEGSFFGRTITISSPNLCFGIRKFGNTATGTVMKPFRFVSKLLPKTILSDDFSPPTWLGQLLGDTYASRMQKATDANYSATTTPCCYPDLKYSSLSTSDEEVITPKWEGKEIDVNPTSPLPKAAGFTGLSNHTGACAMNAGLQTLKVTLNSMCNTLPDKEKQELETRIQTKTPQLWKFLNNKINTEADCLKLHQEMAQKLTEDYWYSHHSSLGIAKQSVDTGYIKSMHSTSIVKVLLHQLQAPQVYFEQSQKTLLSTSKSITHHSAQTLNLKPEFYSSGISMQQFIDKMVLFQNRILDDPLPTALVINNPCYTESVSDVLQPITLLHKDGSLVTYQPKSVLVLVHTEKYGHSCSITKKDNTWYEVDDSKIFSLPETWNYDLEQYVNQHAAMIIYEKVETPSPSVPLETRKKATVSEASVMTAQSLSPKLEKIEILNKLIESLSASSNDDLQCIRVGELLLPHFLFDKKLRNIILTDDKDLSFILHQKRKILAAYQSLAKDDPALLALQQASDAMIEASDALEKAEAASDLDAPQLYDEALQAQGKEIEVREKIVSYYRSLDPNVSEKIQLSNNQLIEDVESHLAHSLSRNYLIQAAKAELLSDSALNQVSSPLNTASSSALDAAIEKATEAQQIWNERITFIEQAQLENPKRAENFSISLAYSKGQAVLWETTALALAAWKKAHAASEGKNHIVPLAEAVGAMSIAAKAWKDSATELEENDAAPKENSRSAFFTAKAAELNQSR